MAFEDRCSPNQANSPGPVSSRVPPPHSSSEGSVYQSQYTCTTIHARFDRSLTVVKVQPMSPQHGQDYQDVKPVIQDNFEDRWKCQPPATIPFSINNILHPEFGLNAIRKTNKIEGPNRAGPNHSMLYKPYLSMDCSKFNLDYSRRGKEECSKFNLEYSRPGKEECSKFKSDYSKLDREECSKFNLEYSRPGKEECSKFKSGYSKPDTEEFSALPPLGGLRQTVSNIGEANRDQPKIVEAQRRPDSASSIVSSTSSGAVSTCGSADAGSQSGNGNLWPAWVFCTRYSDRPSSGPRSRRTKKRSVPEEKRPRTAFSASQLARLKHEFVENRYLTERRRQSLAAELGLAEAQIKIWFQNKRAKIKKATGQRNPLALQLMAQGLYNHSTVTESDEEEEEIHVT